MYFSRTAIHIGISFDPASYKAIIGRGRGGGGSCCETEEDNTKFFLGSGEGESGYHHTRGILNSYIYFDYVFKNKYRVFGSENFFEGFEDDAKSCTRNHA